MENGGNYEKEINRIDALYSERRDILLRGRKVEELNQEKKSIYDKIIRCCLYDPRRPDVGFSTKDMAQQAFEIGEKLDLLSDEEFMTNQYVLDWIDELNSGFKVTMLPEVMPKS